MEHKNRLTLFSIACLAVCVCALVATSAQKPVRQVDVHGEGFGPPETLDELWEQSDIVIDGRVVDVRPANQTITPTVSIPPGTVGGPVTLAQTDYVIQVHRVLKSDNFVGPNTATVTVRRDGGTIDRGESIDEYVDSRFHKFTHQGRYTLFLKAYKANPSLELVYFPAVGADSAFEVVGNRIVPLGRAIASQQLADLGVEQFLSTLAKKGGK